ncbi:MAG: nucleotidyl transferase AbiEii/AbiGii toxin family protein [Solirubrobacterales bacterium]
MPEPTLPGKVVALAQSLETAKIPHAFGGAIALAYYATPRATIDIDLNVFLPPAEFERVAKTFEVLGVDTNADRDLLERDGQCRVAWGRTPVDLFMANVEFHDEMARHTRRQPFGETTIQVLSPEHLIVCKALFDRPKDWIDIEQVVLTMPELKTGEIAAWLGVLAGKRDDRTKRFAAISLADRS